MSRAMRKRLEIIWAKGTPITAARLLHGPATAARLEAEAQDRYVPRAIGMGPGWGVWDRKRDRHLTDAEVARTSVDDLRDEKLTQ